MHVFHINPRMHFRIKIISFTGSGGQKGVLPSTDIQGLATTKIRRLNNEPLQVVNRRRLRSIATLPLSTALSGCQCGVKWGYFYWILHLRKYSFASGFRRRTKCRQNRIKIVTMRARPDRHRYTCTRTEMTQVTI